MVFVNTQGQILVQDSQIQIIFLLQLQVIVAIGETL